MERGDELMGGLEGLGEKVDAKFDRLEERFDAKLEKLEERSRARTDALRAGVTNDMAELRRIMMWTCMTLVLAAVIGALFGM